MKYIYTALFTPIEDGSGYYAKVPDLPGCITTGNSLSDAIDQITDAMSAWLVVAEDEGEPIAPPSPQEKLSVDAGTICSLISADTIEYRAQTDVREKLLSHNEDYIYYKTDHHWTSEGAYLAYETWCDSTGMESTPLADLKKQVATKKFRGSLYSKILDADSAYDSIWTYGDTKQKAYGSDCSLTIDEKKQTDSCYDTAQLSQKDKYKYFFGDNYGTVQIVSDHARHQDRNLLVIKDSFANTFVPFATENYGQITMIDLRYYNGNVEEYMKEHQITDVLVLYNITNFISDRNLYKLVGRI